MVNACDFVFAALLLLSAWLGWKLKSLPLLGAGFAVALAPLCAAQFSPGLGSLLVDKLGGEGLKPYQDQVAWWLIAIATAILLWLIFKGLSNMLASLKLSFLDRGFGAAICAIIFAACLSLNLARLAHASGDTIQKSLMNSWSWAHVRNGKEPAWIESVEKKVESLRLPEPAKKMKSKPIFRPNS